MIALGSDHGGFDLKQRVKAYLDQKNIPYKDYGCPSKESCDYPIFAKAAAEAVASGECEKGIVICTTGIGISIAANKVKGIRCALCGDPLTTTPTCWPWGPASWGATWPSASWRSSSPPASRGGATPAGWGRSPTWRPAAEAAGRKAPRAGGRFRRRNLRPALVFLSKSAIL